MIQCLFEPFQNMGPVFGFLELEFCAPNHDFPAMLDEFVQQGLKAHYLGLNAVGQRQHVEVKCFLKLRVFEKLV